MKSLKKIVSRWRGRFGGIWEHSLFLGLRRMNVVDRIRKKGIRLCYTHRDGTRDRTAFFVVSYPHIHHFEKIYRFMPKDKFSLLILKYEPCKHVFEDIISYCRDNGIHYVTLEYGAWSPWYFEKVVMMAPVYTEEKMAKTYVRYVLSTCDMHWSVLNKMCGMFLCQGRRNVELLEKLHPGRSVVYIKGGYARLQDFKVEKRTSIPAKINILYVPSHGGYSSLFYYRDVLMQLAKDFNVTCKPHPDLYTEEGGSKILDEFAANKIRIIGESIESEHWLSEVDVFITDFGGSMLLGLYLCRPAIFLDAPKDLGFYKFMQNSWSEDLESTDIYLRRFYPTISYENRSSLNPQFIQNVVRNYDADDYDVLRQEFFYTNDRPAGQIFAEALLA